MAYKPEIPRAQRRSASSSDWYEAAALAINAAILAGLWHGSSRCLSSAYSGSWGRCDAAGDAREAAPDPNGLCGIGPRHCSAIPHSFEDTCCP